MKTVNIVLSGLGGQGILFMTKVLARAALNKGLKTMGAETHGMAQRGGSVISHLRLGQVEGSLVRAGSAHFLLALEENEAYRNIPFLAKGAKLYANASPKSFVRQEVRPYLEKMEVKYRAMPADKIAAELGAPMSSNLALLGFFSAFEKSPVTHGDLRKAIDQVTPEKFKEINFKVFDAGFEMGAH
jgi:indolepyruvate ferredoxin oxidoreductase beta subunit